jgi:2-methylaconitate cis-trans-isomerase PrpF
MADFRKIPCVIQRGGTSKGVYLHEKDLPKDQELRDKIILAIFGSPDIRQIDGLGGADPLTSKCAIIGPPERPDADINYTMAQVDITKPVLDYKGNCGNISAGVGPFAIDEGLVPIQEPETVVRIFNTNTRKVLKAFVRIKEGK